MDGAFSLFFVSRYHIAMVTNLTITVIFILTANTCTVHPNSPLKSNITYPKFIIQSIRPLFANPLSYMEHLDNIALGFSLYFLWNLIGSFGNGSWGQGH